MDADVALTADKTHLYPGTRLTLGTGQPIEHGTTLAVILFSDTGRAEASITVGENGIFLEVPSYTTEAGTEIEAQTWRLYDETDSLLVVTARTN